MTLLSSGPTTKVRWQLYQGQASADDPGHFSKRESLDGQWIKSGTRADQTKKITREMLQDMEESRGNTAVRELDVF